MLSENFSALAILFAVSFGAATILPLQSEAVLVGLHVTEKYNVGVLLAVASAGNILGAVVNWLMGRYLIHFQDRKWFPVKEKSLKKATELYQHWGVWTLLLAWVPFIGDPLTLVAGIFRTNFWLFLALVSIGKIARYAVLLSLFVA